MDEADQGVVSWESAVPLNTAKMLPNLVKDCEACFRAREASAQAAEYSHGTTYWIDADAEPQCLLEQLVLSILHAHDKDLASTDGVSRGAEWWSLAIDVDDEVGFHFDKDYGRESEHRINVTPAYATITYLSSEGNATLIVEKPCPPHAGEPLDDGKPIQAAWLCFPRPGKHVRFRGSWLHGAPTLDLPQPQASATLMRPPPPEPLPSKASGQKPKHGRRKRVSLLANVWIGSKPLHAEALPAEMARRLSPVLSKSPFSLGQPTADVVVAERPAAGRRGKPLMSAAGVTADRGERDFNFIIAQEGAGESCLCIRLPLASISEALATAGPGPSLTLRFGYGEASCVDAPC